MIKAFFFDEELRVKSHFKEPQRLFDEQDLLQFFNYNSPKNFTCLSGKLRTVLFTSRIANSTSPGLLDGRTRLSLLQPTPSILKAFLKRFPPKYSLVKNQKKEKNGATRLSLKFQVALFICQHNKR